MVRYSGGGVSPLCRQPDSAAILDHQATPARARQMLHRWRGQGAVGRGASDGPKRAPVGGAWKISEMLSKLSVVGRVLSLR